MREKNETLLMQPVIPKRIHLTIIGKSPMIQHQWSEKAKQQLRDKHAGKKVKNREKRDPKAEFEAATYRTADGQPGIPAGSIARCMIEAAHKDIGIEKTLVRKAVFIISDDPGNIIPLTADEPIMREDIVRLNASSTDLRYRPEFRNWEASFVVEYNPDLMRPEDIVNLLNLAGFGVGIGEWRPQRNGDFGRFEVKGELVDDGE